LKELGVYEKDSIPYCLIIYPKIDDLHSITVLEERKPLLPESTQIEGFKKFHKIGIPVPRITHWP